MSAAAVLAPVFAVALLAFLLLMWMGYLRVGAVRRGEIRMPDIALSEEPWSRQAKQASNAFSNQFELPVLFYVAAALALQTATADVWFVALAWVFAAARYVHALVFVTTNNVPRRAGAYTIGFIALGLMWLLLGLRVVFGGG